MRQQAGWFRRIGSAVVLAVVVLTAAVPASATDDARRGNRVIEDGAGVSAMGVEWTRVQAMDPLGVEWTLRD